MIVHTITTLAVYCPSCGRLEFRELSLFNFSGTSIWQVKCVCGMPLISVSKKGKHFVLYYNCLTCDSSHNLTCCRSHLWTEGLLTLICNETDLEVGFIGSREKVQQAVQNHEHSLTEMADNLGINDFFEEPDVMYRLLAFIYELVEKEQVNCSCGNKNIEVEIFPGHLRLHCELCDAEKTLPAGSMADLEKIKLLRTICLSGGKAAGDGGTSKPNWHHRKSPAPV